MGESSEKKVYDVAVIGAGPAGLTAAMYAGRAGLSVALIESMSPGGQMAQTEHLENYPGFTLSQSGYELSQIMHEQAEYFGAETVYDEVLAVELNAEPKHLKMAYGDLYARTVIIATGARPAKLGLEGEDRLKGNGVSYCATCDGNFFKNKDVCIVGGGDTAVADAIYLSRICRKVYMLVRRDVLRATAIYNERLQDIENVQIIWNTIVESILEEDDAVVGVHVKNRVTDMEYDINANALFVAIGSVPNTEFLNGQLELDESGHIVSNEFGGTGVEGVFAAGDVRAKILRQVSTGVGDGANAAEAVAEYLMMQK